MKALDLLPACAVAVATLCVVGTACSTDDAARSSGSDPSAEPAEVTMLVESVVGTRVAVDGHPEPDVEPGQQFDVTATEHAFAVGSPGAGWSDPVVTDVVSGGLNATQIPWEKLPVGDRERVGIPPRAGGSDDTSGEDESSPSILLPDSFRGFAETTRGESVSGSFVELRDPTGPLEQFLGFEDGDRLFAVEERSSKPLEALLAALRRYYDGDGKPPTWTLLRNGRKVEVSAVVDQNWVEKVAPVGASDEADQPAINVDSEPSGTVHVDGESTGETTPQRVELEPGKHVVTVEFEGGGESSPREVCLDPNSDIKLMFRADDSGSSEGDD